MLTSKTNLKRNKMTKFYWPTVTTIRIIQLLIWTVSGLPGTVQIQVSIGLQLLLMGLFVNYRPHILRGDACLENFNQGIIIFNMYFYLIAFSDMLEKDTSFVINSSIVHLTILGTVIVINISYCA
jgi:hypothetical protein